MATPQLTVKAHDTFPPVTASLADNNGFIDLTNATSVKFLMKGTSVLVTGTAVKATVATPTATASSGSNVLTSVSSFTNLSIGSSLIAVGVIAPGAVVGSYSSGAGTINMVDASGNPLNAIGSGTGISVTINRGTVQYTWAAGDTSTVDTYNVEWEITWTGGGIQTVPNLGIGVAGGDAVIQIVADLEGA